MESALAPPFPIVRPFMTEDDFYREADENSDREYLDGRIATHSPASDRHEGCSDSSSRSPSPPLDIDAHDDER